MTVRVGLYADHLTLREARRQYFDANGFGEGGYDDKWVKFMIGPLPLSIPNSPQRVRSVRLHDLHHVVTDYTTDWTGEAEIGAWEIASNCRDHWAAWVLNLFAMGIGLFIAPSALWRAFVRGRRSGNLYASEFDEGMLDGSVAELRARLRVDAPHDDKATLADALAFVRWSLAAIVALAVAVTITFSPLLLLGWFLLR